MISSRFSLAFMIMIGCCQVVHGQINPPELLCVRSDTLFWNPAINGCGSFVATEIYTSSNRNGPYSLLARITDLAVTTFEHKIAGQSFYYLLADFNCPGETAISSDTLDNRDPTQTMIEVVTVESDGVRISWLENTDPETIGYVIYRTTNRGTTPIDTVFNALEYLDRTADPNTRSETYNVVALDGCGNQGAFDVPHSTIFLTADDDFCNRRIALLWSNYEGWQNGIENNQIWYGSDGSPIIFEHQVNGSDTLAGIFDVVHETQYCIQIVSKRSSSAFTTRSNLICLTADVLRPLEELVINNVTVNSNSEIDIHWTYNADADLDTLEMSRGKDTLSIATLATIGSSSSDQNIYTDRSADVKGGPYYFRLNATDACGTTFQSNTMSSILLRLETSNGDGNLIDWSSFYLPERLLVDYSVCKIDQGMENLLTSTAGSNTSFIDIIPPMPVAGPACYVIKANHTDRTGGDARVARSNTECIDQKVVIFVPNAFVPTGNNTIFRPEFVFENSIAEYAFRVFNRWGGEVFFSQNPQVGWDGNADGSPCAAGTYIYSLEVTLTDGTTEVKSGSVHLLR
ncbi:MAG: hypothetical protein HKN87_01835 [Saprospiraceae bacterium]|nr:hypothetical protein [Saprospiraceae bacterium]